jgi:alkylation response protein AidB-like acyl-CoA dehydrogenase
MLRRMEHLDELARSVADFARAELGATAARSGPADALPAALGEALDALGLFGLALPEAAGGSGMSRVEQAIVGAALGEVDASVAVRVGLHAAALRLLEASGRPWGDDAGCAAGARAAVLVVEGAATVPTALPDERVLFLSRSWGAILAHDTEAVARARRTRPSGGGLWGLALGRATELAAPDSTAPGSNPARSPGAPLPLERAAAEPRLALAAAALGVGRGAYAAARAYAAERIQFQTPIVRFPAIRAKLAAAELALASAGACLRDAAARLDAGDPRATAGALVACAEAAEAVAHDALQIHGGYGYTRDYPVERAFRDACQLRAWATEWQGL